MILKNILKYLYRLSFFPGLINTCFKPGHFYSPVVSLKEIKKKEKQIWNEQKEKQLPGIEFHAEKQLELLGIFSDYYQELPFTESKSSLHYFYKNIFYSYTDAIILYSFLRHFKPQRIIEAGSGFSSALMTDVRKLFLPELNLTFIEPYPKRLKSLFKETDKEEYVIIEKNIQDIDVSVFKQLKEGDFLFIDSTHVSKTGSDVNHILFKILPVINKGVFIHFHDIFYPFEYPKTWVYQGRSWNESYILRAFLMHNSDYEIIMFNDFLHKHHGNAFKTMPLCYKNTGAGLWLKKKS